MRLGGGRGGAQATVPQRFASSLDGMAKNHRQKSKDLSAVGEQGESHSEKWKLRLEDVAYRDDPVYSEASNINFENICLLSNGIRLHLILS